MELCDDAESGVPIGECYTRTPNEARHVVTVLGILCSGDVTAKLKLLFCLHLPGVVLPGELEDKGGS